MFHQAWQVEEGKDRLGKEGNWVRVTEERMEEIKGDSEQAAAD